MSEQRIVTLDGPAGVGKTTLARAVAAKLHIPYLDTGAMFRCLALKMGPGAEGHSPEMLRNLCAQWFFTLSGSGENSVLSCNGVPIGREVRTEAVGLLASRVATIPVVREILKNAQRAIAQQTALVVEGRDMGTVIFPYAKHKFFLDARPEVRALRRIQELKARGEAANLAEVIEQIRTRDHLDRNRDIAPLRPAKDAVLVDTSDLDINEVLNCILQHIQAA